MSNMSFSLKHVFITELSKCDNFRVQNFEMKIYVSDNNNFVFVSTYLW